MPRKPLSNAGATYWYLQAPKSLATTRPVRHFIYRCQMSGTLGILVAPALPNRPPACRSSGAILLRAQLSSVRT
jgi:hypothetical protein